MKKFMICIIMIICCVFTDLCDAKRSELVYFEGTNYELHVFRIYGRNPGKTIMIIGGIQGDESGGFLSADLYADMSLLQGNLIVVPRANFYSILLNRRGVNTDMNRQFAENTVQTYEVKIVEILKKLISESDILLNMHDGTGFYSDTWINNMRNPLKFGQSIIGDCDSYTNPRTGERLDLGEIANSVTEKMNKHIKNQSHQFHFNNHRTNASDSLHKEQRKSATYYAVFHQGIPAFGVESSKSLSLEEKIFHHNLAVNAFMELFDVIPENPPIRLDPPKLNYIVVSINNNTPIVIENGKTMFVNYGDTVFISHVETNYERGVAIDVIEYGTVNDLKKNIQIMKPTQVVVRKDHYVCGTINIVLDNQKPIITKQVPSPSFDSGMLFFKLKVNGKEQYLKNYTRMSVVKGDTIEIINVQSSFADSKELKVNFKGFVGNLKDKSGEDRGFIIRTDYDLKQKFSLNNSGRIYQINALWKDKQVGKLFVEIEEPYLSYVVLKVNDAEKRCLSPGEIVKTDLKGKFEVIDFKTNILNNTGVQLYLKGPNIDNYLIRPNVSIDWNSLGMKKRSKGRYRIDIQKESILIGSVFIDIDTMFSDLPDTPSLSDRIDVHNHSFE